MSRRKRSRSERQAFPAGDAKTPPSGAPATAEEVRHTIVEGLRTMPAFNGRLREDEIRDLIAFLRTLK